MKRLSLIFILLSFSIAISAQVILTTLEDIAKYGIERSLDYKTSLLTLSESKEDVEPLFKFVETELSSNIDFDNETNSISSMDLSIKIPILNELSINGDIDEDLTGKLELSLDPFNLSEKRVQSQLDYKKSLINTETDLLDAEYNAIKYSLYWMIAKNDYDLQYKNWQLEETVYNDDKIRYDSGDITLDDLKDSLIDWSESRNDYISSELKFRDSETDLYDSLGSTQQDVQVSLLNINQLEEALEHIKSITNLENIDFLKSSGWRLSSISVDSAKEHLDKTWVYKPDLSADFSIPYDDEGIQGEEFTASLSFSFTLDDLNKSEKDRAKEYYNISVLENRLKLNEAEVDFKHALDLLESNNISSDMFKIEYEQAKLLYEESKLLLLSGEYSEIDLEESEIYLLESRNSLFEALVTEYLSWLDLKQYL